MVELNSKKCQVFQSNINVMHEVYKIIYQHGQSVGDKEEAISNLIGNENPDILSLN